MELRLANNHSQNYNYKNRNAKIWHFSKSKQLQNNKLKIKPYLVSFRRKKRKFKILARQKKPKRLKCLENSNRKRMQLNHKTKFFWLNLMIKFNNFLKIKNSYLKG